MMLLVASIRYGQQTIAGNDGVQPGDALGIGTGNVLFGR